MSPHLLFLLGSLRLRRVVQDLATSLAAQVDEYRRGELRSDGVCVWWGASAAPNRLRALALREWLSSVEAGLDREPVGTMLFLSDGRELFVAPFVEISWDNEAARERVGAAEGHESAIEEPDCFYRLLDLQRLALDADRIRRFVDRVLDESLGRAARPSPQPRVRPEPYIVPSDALALVGRTAGWRFLSEGTWWAERLLLSSRGVLT